MKAWLKMAARTELQCLQQPNDRENGCNILATSGSWLQIASNGNQLI